MSAVRAGPGGDRAGPGGEVRRLLPRPLRRPPGRRRERRGHARAPRLGRACPTAPVADTLVVPYNGVPELDDDGGLRHRRARGGQHGPRATRPPGSSRACGAPATGSVPCSSSTRSSPGSGWARAVPRLRLGVTPDLWCFGKVIGGGLPVGAFGGRATLIAPLAPDGPRLPGRHPVGEPARHRGRRGGARARWGRRTTTRPPPSGPRASPPSSHAGDRGRAGLGAHVPVEGPLVGLFVGPPGAGAPGDRRTTRRRARW